MSREWQKKAHSCSRRLIRNHIQPFNWWQFRRPWKPIMHHVLSVYLSCRVQLNKHRPILSPAKKPTQSVWPLTSARNRLCINFKVTIFHNIKYLENGTRQSYSDNSSLTGSHMWSIKRCHLQWPRMTPNPNFKGIWHWISQKWYKIETQLKWNTYRNLQVS